MSEQPQLQKVLTVSHAVGLALTIVVGVGVLSLPGLAYQTAGGAALHVWILNAVLVAPLLVILSKLGAKWPGAGGIAGFLQNAFSRRWGAAAEVLLVGTFGLGIPAIALAGGEYCAALIGVGNSADVFAVVLLFAAAAVNWRGASVSGNVQRTLAFALCGVLFAATLGALLFGDNARGTPVASSLDLQTWQMALPAVGLVFFAFTGWEMLTFTAEEYRNPRRDFPLAVGISFVVVVALHLLAAAAVQTVLPRDDLQTAAAPMAALVESITGAAGAAIVSAIAVVILFANLTGAVWAASRLVFASAREGLLPRVLAGLDLRRTPRAAIGACLAAFCLPLAAEVAGAWTAEDMFRLAGQNFFLLYALSIAAYIKIAETKAARMFGAIALALSAAMMGVFGWEMLYPAILLAVGALWHAQTNQNPPQK